MTVLGNLVDNAFDAVAAAPSRAEVRVALGGDAGELVVSVEDSGTGPRRRGGRARARARLDHQGLRATSGRGVGLALVAQVARRHGGEVDDRPVGARRRPSSP